jgi:hypothetical protein
MGDHGPIGVLRRDVDALTKRVARLEAQGGQSGGPQLDRIEGKIDTIQQGVTNMAGELEKLQADVAAEDTVVDSAIVLLEGIKAALDAAIASGNPAALTALSADLEAKTQKLSDAVVANTPTPPPTP